MQKQSIFNVLFTAAIVILFALIVGFIIYSSGNKTVTESIKTNTITTSSTQDTNNVTTATTTAGSLVKKESLSIRTSDYQGDVAVLHLCAGETAKSYETLCVGKNILVLQMSGKPDVVISEQQVSSAEDALFLKAIDFLPDNEKTGSPPILLISFTKDTCASLGDCGVGMPENHVTYKVNLSDLTYSELKHYPQYGIANWSQFEHVAIFIPSSCGGAGCEEETLFAYDLNTDKVTSNITKERAANYPDAVDVMGNPLSYWGEITWESADKAKAILNAADGTSKIIEINI
ncbi:hypothetical protein KKG46_01405 [Patescibacteria group bacterium]|nr:hypothetical protein [Patescibacteria group bacterium]